MDKFQYVIQLDNLKLLADTVDIRFLLVTTVNNMSSLRLVLEVWLLKL